MFIYIQMNTSTVCMCLLQTLIYLLHNIIILNIKRSLILI